ETCVRMIQAFPESASAQLRLCEGMEPLVEIVSAEGQHLEALVDQRQQQIAMVQTLAMTLSDLHSERSTSLEQFLAIGEELLAREKNQQPLEFLNADMQHPAEWIACHSLNVAQVIANVVQCNTGLRSRSIDAVLAGLIHDVGMLGVPAEILAQAGPLED